VTQLSIDLVQTSLAWEEPASNRDHFEALLEGVAPNEATKADLIILPEMFSTGFSMRSAVLAEAMEGDTVSWLKGMARQHDTAFCGSMIIEDAGHYYNRFILARATGELETYDKKHLFRMSAENENYTGGESRPVFEINGFRLFPQVCYDLRFPVFSRNNLEYDAIVYVANWPAARRQHWRTLLAARAIENLCYVVGVNRIGTDGNEVTYSGDSLVADYNGELLADAEDLDTVVRVDLDRDKLAQWRADFPAWKDADPFSLKP
jgi:predicted amidohydrolase